MAGSMMTLDELNLAFRAGFLTVTAVSHWGPLCITWEISGVPKVMDGRFVLDVRTGQVGHLRLPHSCAEWMAGRMAVLFKRWQPERDLLDRLGDLTVEAGRITLSTQTAQQKTDPQ